MLTVNRRQIETVHEGNLITEASTLGLRPGQWPPMIAIRDDNSNLEFLFFRDATGVRDAEGDLEMVVYRTLDAGNRTQLHVLND